MNHNYISEQYKLALIDACALSVKNQIKHSTELKLDESIGFNVESLNQHLEFF